MMGVLTKDLLDANHSVMLLLEAEAVAAGGAAELVAGELVSSPTKRSHGRFGADRILTRVTKRTDGMTLRMRHEGW